MILKDHDLRQIDRDYLETLESGILVEVSLKLLEDLKEARDRLNQTPKNSSRPSGSFAPWEKGVVSEKSPVEEAAPDKEEAEKEERGEETTRKKIRKAEKKTG